MVYDKLYFDKLSDNLSLKEIKSFLFACLHYRLDDNELLTELINKVVSKKFKKQHMKRGINVIIIYIKMK